MPIGDVLRVIAWPVIGAVIGAIVTTRSNHHLTGVKVAVDLQTEFHSGSFWTIRMEADNALKRIGLNGTYLTIAEVQLKCTVEEWRNVSQLLHFFEKLSILMAHNIIDRTVADAVFGRYINYFCQTYFSSLVEASDEWASLTRILHQLPRISKCP